MKCQYCGNEVPVGNQNCPSCGAAAPQVQQNNINLQQGYVNAGIPAGYARKSRVVYILLGLFLGGIGVHNFYAGYTGRAVGQLLITLFIGWLVVPWLCVEIWSLIEICTVDQDSNGIKFN